jgi:hypothetical protein
LLPSSASRTQPQAGQRNSAFSPRIELSSIRRNPAPHSGHITSPFLMPSSFALRCGNASTWIRLRGDRVKLAYPNNRLRTLEGNMDSAKEAADHPDTISDPACDRCVRGG